MKILIKKGRVIDPAQKIDKVSDVLVEKGRIVGIETSIKGTADKTIDAAGRVVAPGFIDMHAHLREPGGEDRETVETGLTAAVSGGFTAVTAMPNTEPACDNQAQVQFLLEKARQAKKAKLLPVGTITKKREGKELTEMAELREAGCFAVTDDGDSVGDPALMRRAMEYASMLGLLVISHCEDKMLAAGGVMNEGYWSTVLGLAPIPAEAESTIVKRDIQLAKLTGARLHIAHISAAESVDLVREAKKKGIKVTTEVTPHHFTLTDENVKTYDTVFKVNPPLRSEDDVAAVKKGLKDGTIDAIATDHAPHLESEKEKEFDFAPFGMIGFETALSLSVMGLVEEGVVDWPGLIRKLSANPCRILGHAGGTLAAGAAADIVVIDPEKEWIYKREAIRSRSGNSPFVGKKLKAAVTDVLVDGHVVLKDGKVS